MSHRRNPILYRQARGSPTESVLRLRKINEKRRHWDIIRLQKYTPGKAACALNDASLLVKERELFMQIAD